MTPTNASEVNLVDTNEARFNEDVFAAPEAVVLVVFWLPGYDLSRAILRFSHQTAAIFGRRIRVVRVEARKNSRLMTRYSVGKLPAFLIVTDHQIQYQISTLDPLVLQAQLREALNTVSLPLSS